ncbi:MAG: hypothetical protein MJH13_08005, partial [Shewanella sp.]|nr:hypothetical protein [Shewanella sp.]
SYISKQFYHSNSTSSRTSEFTPDVSVNDITKQGNKPHSTSSRTSEFTLTEIEPSQAQTNKQTRGEHG